MAPSQPLEAYGDAGAEAIFRADEFAGSRFVCLNIVVNVYRIATDA